MISMWVLWRRLRLNQEGSEAALSEVVANGLLTRYSDIIYDWFLLFNSIPYTTYIILHYITFTLSSMNCSIIYMNCGERYEAMIIHDTYVQVLINCEIIPNPQKIQA